MLLESGLVEQSQGCVCVSVTAAADVSGYVMCAWVMLPRLSLIEGLDFKLSKSELQDKIFPTGVYLSHCDHSIFH